MGPGPYVCWLPGTRHHRLNNKTNSPTWTCGPSENIRKEKIGLGWFPKRPSDVSLVFPLHSHWPCQDCLYRTAQILCLTYSDLLRRMLSPVQNHRRWNPVFVRCSLTAFVNGTEQVTQSIEFLDEGRFLIPLDLARVEMGTANVAERLASNSTSPGSDSGQPPLPSRATARADELAEAMTAEEVIH